MTVGLLETFQNANETKFDYLAKFKHIRYDIYRMSNAFPLNPAFIQKFP